MLDIFWVNFVRTDSILERKELTVHWSAPNSLIGSYFQPCTNSKWVCKGIYMYLIIPNCGCQKGKYFLYRSSNNSSEIRRNGMCLLFWFLFGHFSHSRNPVAVIQDELNGSRRKHDITIFPFLMTTWFFFLKHTIYDFSVLSISFNLLQYPWSISMPSSSSWILSESNSILSINNQNVASSMVTPVFPRGNAHSISNRQPL